MKDRVLFAAITSMLIIGGLAFAQDTTLTITNDGKVGIGTTSPATKLQVSGGDIQFDGNSLFGVGLNEIFTYDNKPMGWFSLGWKSDTWFGYGKTMWISGYGGIKFFTGGVQPAITVGYWGAVGIGTASPDQLLSVNGNASKVGGGSWATFSDVRMKKDINPFNDGLSVLKQINPVTFRYNGKLGYPTDKTYVGVIAQDIEQIAPYTVSTFRTKLNPDDTEETDILQFDGSALIYIAINAIQELDNKIEELNQLKSENEYLNQRLDELESIVKTLAEQKNNSAGESMAELH